MCLLGVGFEPANPQSGGQYHHQWTAGLPIPQPIVTLTIPNTGYTTQYLRCFEIATLADIASAPDWDRCINPGCPFPDGWNAEGKVRISWSDNGAGGTFGTLDSFGNFVPLDPIADAQRITHYRASPNNPGVVHITLVVDDEGLLYDDPPVSNDPSNGNFTVWEFWITPCPKNWRPKLDEDLSFAAWIEPTTDHKGNPMVGTIIFLLSSSNQPGHCLNDCRLGSTGQWAWDGTTGCHDDVQFLPEQPNLLVFPRDQTPEGVGYNYDTAMSSWATNMAMVAVRCLDYGGWAYLRGYVTGFFGEGAARRIDAQDLFVADIPVDENENHIADWWEDFRDPPSRDPLSDDDFTPRGDGTLGDGLSLYEEYRGLMVRGVWQDFDPKEKDMFVMNFGAGNEDPYEPAVILNDAITSQDGFPGAGMPLLWLLNAKEGSGYPPLWGPPVCEIDMNNPNSIGAGLIFVVGHELGHTVLWDEPAYGHHFAPSAQDCFMFQPTIVFWPTEFCGANPGCQSLWKLNP